jgi:hypothetical protein
VIKFRYTNWRGVEHIYVIQPESIEFGPYDNDGRKEGGLKHWVLHGNVVTRDGDPRPEMNPRRRTFLLVDIFDMEEVI